MNKTSHLKSKKRKESKLKESRRKELIKMKVKMNELESRINKLTQGWNNQQNVQTTN
jgi:hypothetical protein